MEEGANNSNKKSGSENPGFISDDEENIPRNSSFATLELNSDSQIVNGNIAKGTAKLSPGETVIDLGPPLSNAKLSKVQDDEETIKGNVVAQFVVKVRSNSQKYFVLHKSYFKIGLLGASILLYHVYLLCAIVYGIKNEIPLDWCNGIGFLLVLTFLVYWSLFYYFILKSTSGVRIVRKLVIPVTDAWKLIWEQWYTKLGVFAALAVGLIVFLAVDTKEQPKRLVSALGIPIIVVLGLLMSKYPGRVKWRQVFWSLAIQFVFGLLILRWTPGRLILDCISDKVKIFLDFSTVGSDFIYGYLSSGKPTGDLIFPTIFVFRGLSVIFFFGFMISLLYHYGIMQWVIVKLGWLLSITIGTTAAESMNAAANIFIGQTEAPLLIKPFINQMTKSELHAIMVGGFATIAGTVMAAYISFGISASYLLSASVMAAPAALGFAKLMYPETKISTTTAKDIKVIQPKSEGNALDAAANGAMQGVTLIGCIVANIIAFVSFVAFLNAVISWLGGLIGFSNLSFELILGKVFIPVAWIIGVDAEECEEVALLLGLKTVANEFIAYKRLAEMTISPRSKAIATYALCSFANVGSVGIQLGGLGAISPERRGDIAKTIGRAFLTGTLVGFLNACMAGMLLSEPGFNEWHSANMSMNSRT